MNNITLSLMSGIDIPIPECQLILHQPSIKEISYIGELSFFTGAQCLCINKSMYEDEMPNSSTFEIFMELMKDKRAQEKKNDVKAILTLLFPNYKFFFTPRSICFNLNEESFTIDESNFEYLQDVIRQVSCLQASGNDAFNPANDAAKAIANKLMRGRQRVAAERAGEAGNSALAQHISTLTIGLHSMSLQAILDLTIFQLYDLIERYQLYMNWDLDIRSKLAGGSPESKIDNWMKALH